MKKKIFIISICVVFLCSTFLYASTISTIAQIAAGAWSGTTRIAPMLFKAGNIAKWVGVGFSPATCAILAGAVLTTWAISNYTQLPYIGVWLTSIGDRLYSGQYQKGTYLVTAYTGDALTAYNWLVTNYQNPLGSLDVVVKFSTSAEAQAWIDANISNAVHCHDIGGYGSGYHSSGAITVYTHAYLLENYGGACALNGKKVIWYYPSAGSYPSAWDFTYPVSQTVTQVKTDLETGLTASNTQARAAYTEMETAMKNALAGTVSPYLSSILDATNSSSERLQDLLNSAARTAGGAVVTQMEADNDAITSGTDVTVQVQAAKAAEEAKAETDPAFTAASEPSVWDDPPSISDLWDNFKDAVLATGIFLLPAALSSGIPGGGTSVMSFNAGVFGSHSYDFSTWSGNVILILRSVFLVIFSFIAIRVVVLKH